MSVLLCFHIVEGVCGVLLRSAALGRMCPFFVLLFAAFARSATTATYEPFDFTNTFNFKWDFGNPEADHVRSRRNADWRPTKLGVGHVDPSWCSKNKELLVKYTGSPLKCGKEYRPSASFDNRPHVPIPNPGRSHTLLMIDPDAPSRNDPKYRSWLHWLVINIRDGDFRNGTEVVGYRPPTPPAGSGKHRYIFLVFQQEGKQKKVETFSERAKFNLNEYAASNDLARVVGFTYFTSQARPKRIKRLSDISDL